MNYKLLVLDLDGTLTNSKKEITPFTREVLIKAQQQGLHLVLASGRPTYGIVPLAETLDMKEYGGFILSFNGGKVIEVKTGKVFYEQALPPDVMPLIYQRSYEAGLTILSYNGKYILTENAADKYVQYESFLTKMKVKETDDFLHNLRLPADKCLIVGEPEDLVPLASGTGPSPQCLSFGTVLPGSRAQRDRQSRFAGTPIGTCADKKRGSYRHR